MRQPSIPDWKNTSKISKSFIAILIADLVGNLALKPIISASKHQAQFKIDWGQTLLEAAVLTSLFATYLLVILKLQHEKGTSGLSSVRQHLEVIDHWEQYFILLLLPVLALESTRRDPQFCALNVLWFTLCCGCAFTARKYFRLAVMCLVALPVGALAATFLQQQSFLSLAITGALLQLVYFGAAWAKKLISYLAGIDLLILLLLIPRVFSEQQQALPLFVVLFILVLAGWLWTIGWMVRRLREEKKLAAVAGKQEALHREQQLADFLHDVFSRQVIFTGRLLAQLREENSDPVQQQQLALAERSVSGLASQLQSFIRSLATGNQPDLALLENFELLQVQQECVNSLRALGFTVEITGHPAGQLSVRNQALFNLVLGELTGNAIKYAAIDAPILLQWQATSDALTLSWHNHPNQNARQTSLGFGLDSLNTRLQAVGGSLQLETAAGFTVKITIPSQAA